jgi:hypothetical protein
MKKYFFVIFASVLVFFGCKKAENFSPIPEIEFVSFSKNPIKAFDETLIIELSYKDGDGDLGENANDVNNIFITDSRNNVEYKMRIKQLAPDNANIQIQGTLKIEMNSVPLVNLNSNSETLSYSIYLIDRAGNKSNTITTEQLRVNK